MGLITWTKSWSSSDNGTILYGQDIQNIQSDIAAVVNGNITDANVKSTAAVAESKIAFNTTTGHTHNGTDSRSISTPAKHYRKGLLLHGDDDENVCVAPGALDIAGTILASVADSGDIAIATDANWVTGARGSVTSAWIYVYAKNNAGVLQFKLSNAVPNLSDASDNVIEKPYRYYKYTDTYYRCVGAVYVDADGDLCWGQASSEGKYVAQFDASNMCAFGGLGTGADQTMVTIWTPKYVMNLYGATDATPAAGEYLQIFRATQQMLDTAWYGTALNVATINDLGAQWYAITDAGSINAIAAQTVSVAGSFTIDAMADGYYWYATAWTDEV